MAGGGIGAARGEAEAGLGDWGQFSRRRNQDYFGPVAWQFSITRQATSVLTAIGNDYGCGLGRPGDVLIAISTSGRSPNIIAALKAAREIGLTTVGFTGSGTRAMAAFCDLCLCAPSDETPQIQQIHIVAAHAICGLVESELFGKSAAPSKSAEHVKPGLSREPR
jgi:DNA-binding MurR/RpiR family transcriptional regulator